MSLFLDSEEVKVHLYKKGFKSDYWYLTCHGESDPSLSAVNTYLWTATTTQEGHNEAKKIIDKLCKRNEEIRKKTNHSSYLWCRDFGKKT